MILLLKKMKNNKKINVEFEKVDKSYFLYKDWNTLEHWIENVQCGGFIDYDGFGQLANDNEIAKNIYVKPSYVDRENSKLKFILYAFDEKTEISDEWLKNNNLTHVVWYNK